MTPVSSSTSYCSASRFFDYFDHRAVADLVRDDNLPAPTRVQLLDSTDTAGSRVVQSLLAASGLVESACTHGNRYLPTDLAALTGSSLAHLQRIVAGLAFGALMERRQPVAAVRENVPAVAEADKILERLRLGEHVFGLAENQAAAQRMDGIRFADVQETDTTGIVNRASRYFGSRGTS